MLRPQAAQIGDQYGAAGTRPVRDVTSDANGLAGLGRVTSAAATEVKLVKPAKLALPQTGMGSPVVIAGSRLGTNRVDP